ncbi:putative sec-independent protein translocase protein TatA/E (plasmid) [Ensifer adhaerens OV14]|nr:putative sec-independent protein translocase protein TatA/E [Ensifer adhaerens OV14]
MIVLAVVLLLFGRGKIPELMGDVAKGIRSFKNGLSDETAAPAEKRIETGSGE